MIRINTMALGNYQTNCYIVRAVDAKSCAVIDPGYTPDVILAFLEKEGLALDAILLTHGHFDHVGAVKGLAKATIPSSKIPPTSISTPWPTVTSPRSTSAKKRKRSPPVA